MPRKHSQQVEDEEQIEQAEPAVPVASAPPNYRALLNEGLLSTRYLVSLVQALGWAIHPNARIMVVAGGAYFDHAAGLSITLYEVEDWEFAARCRSPLMIGRLEDNTFLAVRIPLFTDPDGATLPLQLFEDRTLS